MTQRSRANFWGGIPCSLLHGSSGGKLSMVAEGYPHERSMLRGSTLWSSSPSLSGEYSDKSGLWALPKWKPQAQMRHVNCELLYESLNLSMYFQQICANRGLSALILRCHVAWAVSVQCQLERPLVDLPRRLPGTQPSTMIKKTSQSNLILNTLVNSSYLPATATNY